MNCWNPPGNSTSYHLSAKLLSQNFSFLLSGLGFFNFKIYNAQPIEPTVFSLLQLVYNHNVYSSKNLPKLLEMPCYLLSQLYLISLGSLWVCNTGGHKPDPQLKANLPFLREQTQGFSVITVSSLLFCSVIIVLMQKVGPDLSLTARRGRFLETTPPTK